MRPAEPTIAPIKHPSAFHVAYYCNLGVVSADVCSAGVMTFGCKATRKAPWSARMSVARSVESPAEDGLTSTISGFRGRLLRVAPSVERRGSCVTLQFIPIMNEDQSLRVRLCWTQEKLAMNLRRMGWPIIRENARRLKARLPLPNQPLAKFSLSELLSAAACRFPRGERGGFDLAADFLYSIVISIIMTFQTKGIGNTARKLAGAELGGAIDTVASSVCAGIDEHLSSSRRFPCNSLKTSILGV